MSLILYYDGLCPLCSREIDHYRKRVRGGTVSFVDITDPSFDAAAHGLDTRSIHRTMHARRGSRVYIGLDAFIALWEAVPGYAWLARLARVPALHEMMRVGYGLFALFRPLLPRLRRDDCATGVCRR
jgi:predicted DCC family thiol-disulfide oxidoreductase YuxK